MKDKKIAIIGAGIGGLTLGVFLKENGFDVQIFEKSNALRSGGAGIIMACNANQILIKAGLYNSVLKKGNEIASFDITDDKLLPIQSSDIAVFKEKIGVGNIAISREDLHQILADQFNETEILFGKELVEIKKNEQSKLVFKDGSAYRADLIFGADGIASQVRKYVSGQIPIRDSKQFCWRAIVNYALPLEFESKLTEVWGVGKRFGFVKTGPNKVYWYALTNAEIKNSNALKKSLKDRFSDSHYLIQELLDAAEEGSITTNKLGDIPPLKHWYKGSICLLGDAAHATTPNLGQGACQAIESAYRLAKCLNEYNNHEEAFKAYFDYRFKKASGVTNTSWNVGKIAQIENKTLIIGRNWFFRRIPKSVGEKQNKKLFTI